MYNVAVQSTLNVQTTWEMDTENYYILYSFLEEDQITLKSIVFI
jgi:hypothetical protein